MTQPQPGWYTDPYDANQRRWWSGSIWTDDCAPLHESADPSVAIGPPPVGQQPLSTPAAFPTTSPGCASPKLLIALAGAFFGILVLAGVVFAVSSGSSTTAACDGLAVIDIGESANGQTQRLSAGDSGVRCLVVSNRDAGQVELRATSRNGDLLMEVRDLESGRSVGFADDSIGSDPIITTFLPEGAYQISIWEYMDNIVDWNLTVDRF